MTNTGASPGCTASQPRGKGRPSKRAPGNAGLDQMNEQMRGRSRGGIRIAQIGEGFLEEVTFALSFGARGGT